MNYMIETIDFILMISLDSMLMIRKCADPHTGLIQTETEPLCNKRILTEYCNLKGASCVLIYLYII